MVSDESMWARPLAPRSAVDQDGRRRPRDRTEITLAYGRKADKQFGEQRAMALSLPHSCGVPVRRARRDPGEAARMRREG